jgi:hypothetical protein
MIRRLNYTGRLRIPREDVRIFVIERQDMPAAFKADLDLSGYGLPDDAKVYIEAYRQTVWMRFPFGTAAKPAQPDSTELTEFDSPEAILFRVRVTSVEGADGKLLAEADRIRGRNTEERDEDVEPLLPVIPGELGAQVWALEIDDRPRLVINKELWDWKAVALAPPFVSLVYPAVFRQILDNILGDEYFDTDDPDDWRSQWLRFAMLIPGVPEIPEDKTNSDNLRDWASDVVASFCRQQGMLGRFLMFWRPEGAR